MAVYPRTSEAWSVRRHSSRIEKGTFEEAEKTLSVKRGCPVDRVEGDDGEIMGEEKFRTEYLFATIMAVREGCKFARAIGVDESTIKEGESLCDTLEHTAEKPTQKIPR